MVFGSILYCLIELIDIYLSYFDGMIWRACPSIPTTGSFSLTERSH